MKQQQQQQHQKQQQHKPFLRHFRNSIASSLFVLIIFSLLFEVQLIINQNSTLIEHDEDVFTLPTKRSSHFSHLNMNNKNSSIIDSIITTRNNNNNNNNNSSNMKIGICHKTLFGDIDLQHILMWAKYHHNLGFNTIFIWYNPSLESQPYFEELKNLPYVELIRLEKENKPKKRLYKIVALNDAQEGNQDQCDRSCLQITAQRNYDWVGIIDADEFFWFNNTNNVHNFIHEYGTKQNNTYLSFGKWMYDLRSSIAPNSSIYDLKKYPFTTKSFCKKKGKIGDAICPFHKGRSKILLKPTIYKNISLKVHGSIQPDPKNGSIHFHTDIAHLKEWPTLWKHALPEMKRSQLVRPRHDYLVSNWKELTVHELEKGHKPYPNGTYHVYYDNQLEDWINSIS